MVKNKALFLPPSMSVLARVRNRAVLSVTGSQATEFLAGVLASTVHPPTAGPFFSALLNAQARDSKVISVIPLAAYTSIHRAEFSMTFSYIHISPRTRSLDISLNTTRDQLNTLSWTQ